MLVAGFLLFFLPGFGQRNCGSHEYMIQQMQKNPVFAENINKIEAFTQQYLKSPRLKAGTVITIPVHVIVVYANTAQNISDAQIQSQISVLNLDYRKLNSDWPGTPAEFIDRVADVQIEFVLQGIERHSNSKSQWGLNDLVKSTYPPYLPTTHLNFWVCNIGGGYLGYAQFPGGASATDGVVISPQYFGSKNYSNGTFYLSSPFDLGRTATHEVGHWLNLRHIWGDGTCATDYVDDTPTAQQANYGCPTHPHLTCGSNDMFMNYMDYVDDGCMFMFTIGQTARAQAIFATGGPRASFVSGGSSNISPVAEANGPYTGTAGVAITFSSAGSADSDGTIASYSWNFGDGSTSTSQNPSHIYSTAGTYTATLTVTDNAGASSSDVATVTVSTSGGGTTTELSYSDFESGWGIWTKGGADCSRYTSTTYAYGGKSAIDIQDNTGTASSFYHTTGVNVSTPGYTSIIVDFYFYAVSMEAGEDFWVQYYNGSTWSTVTTYASGTNFNNSTFYHATITIPKSSYTFPTNMKIRFMCDASDNNDDVYIDNIRITGSTGTAKIAAENWIEEITNLRTAPVVELPDNLKLSPNPAEETLTVSYAADENTRVNIYTVSGKNVITGKLSKDVNDIDISKLKPGVYLIKVSSGKESVTKKFIKK
jgi:PKD repeat protein